MIMFCFHMAFFLGLIALVLGGMLLVFAKLHDNLGTFLAKTIAYLVIIIAFIHLSCASYYGFKYWQEGYFAKSMPMAVQIHKMMGEPKMFLQALQEKLLEKK